MQTRSRLTFVVLNLQVLMPFWTNTSNIIKQTTGMMTLRIVEVLLTRSSTRALDGRGRRAGMMMMSLEKKPMMTVQNWVSPRKRRTAL
jgi:hypothetical protein